MGSRTLSIAVQTRLQMRSRTSIASCCLLLVLVSLSWCITLTSLWLLIESRFADTHRTLLSRRIRMATSSPDVKALFNSHSHSHSPSQVYKLPEHDEQDDAGFQAPSQEGNEYYRPPPRIVSSIVVRVLAWYLYGVLFSATPHPSPSFLVSASTRTKRLNAVRTGGSRKS